MFTRILVPTAGSSRDTDAIEMASQLADRFGADMVLLHVERALASLEQALDDNRHLERQVSALRQRGLRVHHAMEFGQVSDSITGSVEAEQASLVVLAPHHRTRLESLGHPRVVSRLLGHTGVPLLVLPEFATRCHQAGLLDLTGSLVLVPLDGSDLAEQALPYAIEFARTYCRPLLLVYVVPPVLSMGATGESLLADVDYQARAEQDAHGYLSAIRRRLSQDEPGLQVQSMILSGEPWRELQRCAETHDGSLMVMSTHGRTGLSRALLGSVAERLAHACPLPLLIVPPGTSGATRNSVGLDDDRRHERRIS